MMRQSAAVLGCLAAMLGSTAAINCKTRDVWARNSTGEGGYCSAYPELIPASTHLTNEWGWNNWVEADVTAVTLDLWAGATGCDTAQGELVGKLDVTYDGKDATVIFQPASGVTFTSYNVYLGCPKWYVQPANGEITNQYLKLPLGGGPGPHVYDVGSHGFYVQAHAKEEVCASCVEGEHVWARNSTGEGCFLDYPELPTATWGWTNWIEQGTASTTLTLYAKAWNCNIGLWNEVVGTVVVKYNDQDVEYEFFPASGVTFSEYDVYISCDKWQKKPTTLDLTVNPMYFHNKEAKKTVNWIGPHGFYVQAHAKRSCPTDPPRGPAPGGVITPPPNVQSNLCPIAMTVNGTANFESSCECEKFNCDKPTQPWSSRNMRFCRNCPAFLEDSYHFSCPHCAAAGTEVSFTCPNQWEACDVFVQAHSTCATGSTDGGLPYNLVSEGWTAGSCGPSFCLPFDSTCQNPGNNTAVVQPAGTETNIKWGMVLFHKQFAGGEEMPIPQFATEPTMYFTFFVREGRFCSNDKNETECAQGPSVCAWDDQRQDPCHASLCPAQEPKPGGPCCDVASGVDEGNCGAPETAITQMCHFNLPECDQGQLPQ